MNLQRFDGQCVQITDTNGNIFEGNCEYFNECYNEHEFGRNEECLRIVNFLFYKSNICKIKSLQNHQGSYGHFSESYGLIEEMNTRDGIDSIREVLFCEDHEHVHRMLLCLQSYLVPHQGEMSICRGEIIEALKELRDVTDHEGIKKDVERLIAARKT